MAVSHYLKVSRIIIPTNDLVATKIALKDRTAPMLLTITPGESLEEPPQIIVRGGPLSPHFYRASVILDSLLYRYAEAWSGQPEVVKIVELPIVVAQSPQTEFDLYAPGRKQILKT